ncbi:concanavalin A-like lectin/glucanase domain-containing protein [Scenedesmus sp. NREL 46B-D3]|nr:concanavalin A-like lectin/glucanase domain-containing protein [Scenedesmus sp. NREL 46B-D3]
MPFCTGELHTMHVVSPAYDCWCMTLIPDDSARLPAAACSSGGNGVAVFYRFKDASKQMCRLAPVPLTRGSFDIHYNEQHAAFTDAGNSPEMTLQQQGPDGIRLATNDGMHLYGQYQVTAKIAGASGVVTAFYVRSTDTYTLGNKDSPFHEIDIEFLNGNPAPPNSIWLNTYKNGISGGETLVKPADYQKLLGLSPGQTAENTYITYGFNWQPDYVMWLLNGKALQRRLYGQNITWTEMDGRSYW